MTTPSVRRFGLGAWLAAAALLVSAGGAAANVPLTKISQDPFANTTSQHATEVEPDTFSNGNTIVSAFQVGRFFNGGATHIAFYRPPHGAATDIGFSRATDGGAAWSSGFLPGLTATSGIGGATGAPFERVSDASVAYDKRHNTWLISSIPLEFQTTNVPTIFISRST